MSQSARLRLWLATAGVILATLLAGVRAGDAAERAATAPAAAADAATRARLEGHLAFLADDLLAGRFTGTDEYEIAARYVASQLQGLGLRPVAGDSYLLPVPFVAAELDVDSATVELVLGGKRRKLAWLDDFVMSGSVVSESNDVEAPLVFVGHGVVAPALGWDDYAALDVEGKIVLMMSGAPASFGSEERAHHSRGRQKEKVAAEHGAVGILTFRSPVDAKRRPWERVRFHAASRPEMDWVEADGRPHGATTLQGDATLSDEAAEALFTAIGRDIARVQAAATQRAGTGFALPGSARIASRSRHARTVSSNVAALLPGSDPALADEVVVYSAHLDHLSPGKEVDGDGIYNGFYDNAMGVSLVLESARALATAPRPPRRSVLFLAVTGEERGLLGSAHFAHNPPAALGPLVANVNVDMPVFMHPVADIVAFGAEHSTIEPLAERAARDAGFALSPDPMPEEVIFVRSDQYSFVEVGIPAVFLVPGFGSRDPRASGQAAKDLFHDKHYHMPSDELGLPVDWPSVLRFLDANVQLGREIANAAARPAWKPGDFFGETFAAGK
jgi:Zn-dependent M28 family amino/carboxypeptidase